MWEVERKIREWILIPGLSPANTYGVFNNTVNVLTKAMLERYYSCEVETGVFEAPLVPIEGAFDRLDGFRTKLRARMPQCNVSSVQEVVEMYTGRKRIVYTQAAEDLAINGVQRHDAHLSAFTKFEKVDVKKAPRSINPRKPVYNLEVARYLKKFEKVVYNKIAKVWGDGPTVLKGYNSEEQAKILHGKWRRFNDPVAVGLDAKKFDMHVSHDALSWEHEFYNMCFKSRKLKRLLKMQLQNVGVAYLPDGRIKFKIRGTRSSGDLNTALGNCLLMCAMVHAWAEHCGVDCVLANNGDDCIVIMERVDLDKFKSGLVKWFEEMGFRMKVEPAVDEFENIEFCQTNPVWNGDKWLMVRNPKTCFVKDPMCIHPMQTSDALRKWCTAVGECGEVLNQGIPVMQEFYNAFLRIGAGKKSDKMKEHVFRNEGKLSLARGMKKTRRIVDSSARLSFWKAFGIAPDEQRAMEKYFTDYTCDLNTYMSPYKTSQQAMDKKDCDMYYEYEVDELHYA